MALNATTSVAAIGANDVSFAVTSATGITAPNFTTGVGITYLFVEQEWMLVTNVVGTTVSVQRGVLGSASQAHTSGVIVLAGLPTDFPSPIPISVKASQDYYPNVIGFSAAVASASTITATGYFFHVTGTTAVVTINPPAAGPSGGAFPVDGSQINIVFDGACSFTAAGNIGAATTAALVAGSLVTFTFDQSTSKWYPSRTA